MRLAKLMFGVIVCLVCFSWSSHAAECKSVIGVWDVSGKYAIYDGSSNSFLFRNVNYVVTITGQDGCSFYGHVTMPSDPNYWCPVTGSIVGRDITLTTCDASARGKLSNYDTAKGIYRTVRFSTATPMVFYGDFQSSGTGLATRR